MSLKRGDSGVQREVHGVLVWLFEASRHRPMSATLTAQTIRLLRSRYFRRWRHRKAGAHPSGKASVPFVHHAQFQRGCAAQDALVCQTLTPGSCIDDATSPC